MKKGKIPAAILFPNNLIGPGKEFSGTGCCRDNYFMSCLLKVSDTGCTQFLFACRNLDHENRNRGLPDNLLGCRAQEGVKDG